MTRSRRPRNLPVESGRPVVVVHGGAGNRRRDADALRHGCGVAAQAGLQVLLDGGDALEAVEAAVCELEDDPVFNAGTGGALNQDGRLELDASIMEGATLQAGGVAALPPFAHPISIARAVMDDGRHVLYVGDGARAFAEEAGFVPSTTEQMQTPRSTHQLSKVLEAQAERDPDTVLDGMGTVGAVAVDAAGHVAAGTSTGGTIGQRPGRVGDTPLIGCGTYADDALGACSTTGLGESIIRATWAFRAVHLLGDVAPQRAAEEALDLLTERFGGRGGLILVDRRGRVGVARSTRLMSHAIARPGRSLHTGG